MVRAASEKISIVMVDLSLLPVHLHLSHLFVLAFVRNDFCRKSLRRGAEIIRGLRER